MRILTPHAPALHTPSVSHAASRVCGPAYVSLTPFSLDSAHQMGFETQQPELHVRRSSSTTTSTAATSTAPTTRTPRLSSPIATTQAQQKLLVMIKNNCVLVEQPKLKKAAFKDLMGRRDQAGHQKRTNRGTWQGRVVDSWMGDGTALGMFVEEHHRLTGQILRHFLNVNYGGRMCDDEDDDDEGDDNDEMTVASQDELEFFFVSEESIDDIVGWHKDTFLFQEATHRQLNYFMLNGKRGGIYIKRGSACVSISVPPGCALLASKARRFISEPPPPCCTLTFATGSRLSPLVLRLRSCSRRARTRTRRAGAPSRSCPRCVARSCPRR